MNNLETQIDNLRTLLQSYDQIAGAAEAYNTGKVELAQNITAKGVQAEPTETLPELAEKVAAISQETIQIDGGDMYAKQLFGSLTTPNYWNLYEILEQLLSDGRLVNYGGILLAEYYKGYDSLALSGAGAGGAYVVSDKDGDGQFIMYNSDTTHTWDTNDDGKGNRWVAYCFAEEYHNFDITNTNTSPRSIFIGRNVGKITSLADGRVSEIIVPDGNELVDFDTTGHTQNYGNKFILRNLKNSDGVKLFRSLNTEKVYISGHTLSGTVFYNWTGGGASLLSSIIIECEKANSLSLIYSLYSSNLSEVVIKCQSGIVYLGSANDGLYANTPTLKIVTIIGAEDLKADLHTYTSSVAVNFNTIYIGYKTNDRTKAIELLRPDKTYCNDLILEFNWCKPITATLPNLTEANMYAHILQRLKQDEADCGDGVTVTLGASNLAKLTSQESIDLLDLLTNTYGYTFA